MKSPPLPAKTINVGLGGIAISFKPGRLRALRDDKVEQLMASMKVSGLLQPIVLRPKKLGYLLVAGVHRLEAARRLKWTSIRANVFEGMSADAAELAEIDENLIRAELTPAEEALHINRRKELYLKRHPETKQGGAPGKAGGGKKAKVAKTAAFVDDTAGKTGKASRTVRLGATRGKKGKAWLPDVAGTSLDKGAEIDALIELPADKRDELIEQAKAGEAVSARKDTAKVDPVEHVRQLIRRMTGDQKRQVLSWLLADVASMSQTAA